MSLLIIILIILDMITKWLYIATVYNNDTGRDNTLYTIFRAIFFRGWQAGYFDSDRLNRMCKRQIIPYAAILLMGLFVALLFPPVNIFGVQIHYVVSIFLYSVPMLCEIFSVAENLKQLGFPYATFVVAVIRQSVYRVLGVQGTTLQLDTDQQPTSDKELNNNSIQ